MPLASAGGELPLGMLAGGGGEFAAGGAAEARFGDPGGGALFQVMPLASFTPAGAPGGGAAAEAGGAGGMGDDGDAQDREDKNGEPRKTCLIQLHLKISVWPADAPRQITPGV